jgi:hypothetical protein
VAPALVKEALQGDGRSYLLISEAQYEFWVSVPALEVKVGDHLLLGYGPLQNSVRSEALGREFAAITLIEQVKVVSADEAAASVRLAPAEGGQDIQAIYAQRSALAGQPVKVRGRVVKASKGIFGKNWYHLQDGTRGPGDKEDDLTINSEADAAVGDVVLAEGSLTINKDLGFGYFYAAIIEDAKVTVEKAGVSP